MLIVEIISKIVISCAEIKNCDIKIYESQHSLYSEGESYLAEK